MVDGQHGSALGDGFAISYSVVPAATKKVEAFATDSFYPGIIDGLIYPDNISSIGSPRR